MPLTDLLQWADATSVRGRLLLHQGPMQVELRLADRHVVGVSAPSSDLDQVRELSPVSTPGALSAEGEARERLLDLFLDMSGRFSFTPEGGGEAPGEVPVRLPLGWLTLEGMRTRDEWPRISTAFPDAGARIERAGEARSGRVPAAAEALLALAEKRPTLGEARVALGLSRSALLRQADLLCNLGLVRVDGARPGSDPLAKVLSQVEMLLDEEQYDEAAHVVEAMLAADPQDVVLRELRTNIENRHREALYARLGASALPRRTSRALPRLLPMDRHVLELVDDHSAVQAIVDRSSLREVVTLKSLERLAQRGLVALS